MPRGQKSKFRARGKRHHTHDDNTHDDNRPSKGARAAAAEEGELPSSSTLGSESASQSAPAASVPQEPSGSQATSSAVVTSSCHSLDEDAESHNEENPQCFYSASDTESEERVDPLTRMAGMLVQFLLQKYKAKESVTKADILKIISNKYVNDYSEIFKRTTDRLELVFGLELKETDTKSNTYTVVSKLNLPSDGCLNEGSGFPKNGLLMPLLGVILINEDRVPEDEMWDFLNILGLYEGRKHFIFGEPRKFVTVDLVQEGYLEYRQVPGSNPPTYEFLWGSRAHAETNKMKVLEFLAKINGTTRSSFQYRYQEAVRDEEQQAQARIAGRAGTVPDRPVFD